VHFCTDTQAFKYFLVGQFTLVKIPFHQCIITFAATCQVAMGVFYVFEVCRVTQLFRLYRLSSRQVVHPEGLFLTPGSCTGPGVF
jgi:hypothetical protein